MVNNWSAIEWCLYGIIISFNLLNFIFWVCKICIDCKSHTPHNTAPMMKPLFLFNKKDRLKNKLDKRLNKSKNKLHKRRKSVNIIMSELKKENEK